MEGRLIAPFLICGILLLAHMFYGIASGLTVNHPLVTIYIPFADYHRQVVRRAIDSAERQTVPCVVMAGHSPRTPARFRNEALQASTPFVCFLDADDVLMPTFVERCLQAYQTGRYVFTSWLCGDVLRKPNLCVTRDEDYHSHLTTTLYPAAVFKALNGFDESLPGHEDVDFYLRSAEAGVCGVHVDAPLLHYTNDGQRSELFNARADKKAIMDDVFLRHGGQKTIMACCGQPGEPAQQSLGPELPGDVVAQTLWAGNRSEVGAVTGRVYRGGNGSKVSVDPRDIEQMPHLFKTVKDLRKLAPERDKVLKESGLV